MHYFLVYNDLKLFLVFNNTNLLDFRINRLIHRYDILRYNKIAQLIIEDILLSVKLIHYLLYLKKNLII